MHFTGYHKLSPSVDQRGLGRSLPSFANKDCMPKPGDAVLDYSSESDVKRSLAAHRERVTSCWNHSEFFLKGENNTEFHFLEFSGTTQLVQDLNRFRVAIGWV